MPGRNKVSELFPEPDDRRGHSARLDEAVELLRKGEFSAALICVVKLIDEGCSEAYYYAGRIYEEGGKGVERDLSKAVFYYEKSMEDYGSIEGALALGRMYYFGIGVSQNYQKALELLTLVEHHGVAQLLLGQMYAFGHGVKRDFDIARTHFQKAADQGYVFALSALSDLEWKSGHYLKSVALRIRAISQAARVTWKDANDNRLRRS